MTLNQTKLVEDNIKFGYWKASEWNKKQNYIDHDELISLASLALTKAAQSYDPTRNATFITYASFVIDNEIVQAIKKAKRHIDRNISYEEYTCNGDMAAITQEEIDYDEVLDVREAIDNIMDLAVTEEDIEDRERQKQFIEDYYYKGMTQQQISDKYGTCQSNVYYILERAKQNIASYMKIK